MIHLILHLLIYTFFHCSFGDVTFAFCDPCSLHLFWWFVVDIRFYYHSVVILRFYILPMHSFYILVFISTMSYSDTDGGCCWWFYVTFDTHSFWWHSYDTFVVRCFILPTPPYHYIHSPTYHSFLHSFYRFLHLSYVVHYYDHWWFTVWYSVLIVVLLPHSFIWYRCILNSLHSFYGVHLHFGDTFVLVHRYVTVTMHSDLRRCFWLHFLIFDVDAFCSVVSFLPFIHYCSDDSLHCCCLIPSPFYWWWPYSRWFWHSFILLFGDIWSRYILFIYILRYITPMHCPCSFCTTRYLFSDTGSISTFYIHSWWWYDPHSIGIHFILIRCDVRYIYSFIHRFSTPIHSFDYSFNSTYIPNSHSDIILRYHIPDLPFISGYVFIPMLFYVVMFSMFDGWRCDHSTPTHSYHLQIHLERYDHCDPIWWLVVLILPIRYIPHSPCLFPLPVIYHYILPIHWFPFRVDHSYLLVIPFLTWYSSTFWPTFFYIWYHWSTFIHWYDSTYIRWSTEKYILGDTVYLILPFRWRYILLFCYIPPVTILPDTIPFVFCSLHSTILMVFLFYICSTCSIHLSICWLFPTIVTTLEYIPYISTDIHFDSFLHSLMIPTFDDHSTWFYRLLFIWPFWWWYSDVDTIHSVTILFVSYISIPLLFHCSCWFHSTRYSRSIYSPTTLFPHCCSMIPSFPDISFTIPFGDHHYRYFHYHSVRWYHLFDTIPIRYRFYHSDFYVCDDCSTFCSFCSVFVPTFYSTILPHSGNFWWFTVMMQFDDILPVWSTLISFVVVRYIGDWSPFHDILTPFVPFPMRWCSVTDRWRRRCIPGVLRYRWHSIRYHSTAFTIPSVHCSDDLHSTIVLDLHSDHSFIPFGTFVPHTTYHSFRPSVRPHHSTFVWCIPNSFPVLTLHSFLLIHSTF